MQERERCSPSGFPLTPSADPVKQPPVSLARLFRLLLIVIPIGVAGNIAFTWYTVDRVYIPQFENMRPFYLSLAAVLAFVPWVTHTLRLFIWMRFLGLNPSLKDAFCIVLGNDLGAAATPTVLGGGPVKAGMLIQQGATPGAALSLALLATVEDFVFILLVMPVVAWIVLPEYVAPLVAGFLSSRGVAMIFRPETARALAAVAVVAVVALMAQKVVFGRWMPAGIGSSRPRGIRERFLAVLGQFSHVCLLIARRGKGRFLLTLLLASVQWTCRYSVATALAASLGFEANPVLYFFLQWVVFVIMALVPTPGAAGGAEAAFYFVFSPLLPAGAAGILTAGWRFTTYYLLLMVDAVVFLVLTSIRGKGKGKGIKEPPAANF